ncbi:MAG: hypothetical protein ACLUD0_07330 [Eubacterium ramulus]
MSEVDGAYTAGTNAGEMTAALGLAQRMMTDVNGLNLLHGFSGMPLICMRTA